MTLTEFLLARIAEEEANVADCGCIQGGEVPETLVEHRLRECEAKRRIVEWHIAGNDDGYVCRNILCPHLAALASVYADHPDYREEWRP